MIPGKIIRFLDAYANLAFAGTRSRDLVPYGHYVSGWRVGGDGRSLTALVAEGFSARLLESLEDNGEFALTVEEFPSHETYQFKGRYLRHRPLQPEDLEVVDRVRERFVKALRPLYPDREGPLKAFILKPGLAVEFEVKEVYLQTPGPGAGTRLAPPAEAAEVIATELPAEIRPVLDNGVPAVMVTCSAAGVPNVTVISQVHYVDATHAALSFQFFSKTIRNVRENPRAHVSLSDIAGGAHWVLQLEFERSETEGPIFDVMEMQIEAIASATGMSGIFKLRAADIYRVVSAERLPYAPGIAS